MIKIWVIGGQEVTARLDKIVPEVRLAVTGSVRRLLLMLQRKVKEEKLSGQVLHVRSGTLRRSINQRLELSDTAVTGVVGTNVSYAGVHEFGGRFTVKEHSRLVKQAFGKELRFPVWARVGQHDINFPERSFLRSALREMENEIRTTLEKDVALAATKVLK